MALILCIETTTTNCSVALVEGGKVIASKSHSEGYTHAENLHPFIYEVLASCERKTDSLDAVAISKGPGSYTGLRIGVSTAKGLCHALDIPLIAVETLQVMALEVAQRYKGENYLFCPMIDARRMEVFAAVFNEKGGYVRETQADIVDEKTYLSFIKNNKLVFSGTGAAKCRDLLSSEKNVIFDEKVFPFAEDMVELVNKAYENEDFENVAYFEPYYLKDFIATTPKKLL